MFVRPENHDHASQIPNVTFRVSLDGRRPRYQVIEVPALSQARYRTIPFVDGNNNQLNPPTVSLTDEYQTMDLDASAEFLLSGKNNPDYELTLFRDPDDPQTIKHFHYKPDAGINYTRIFNSFSGFDTPSGRNRATANFMSAHYPEILVTDDALVLKSGHNVLMGLTAQGLIENPKMFNKTSLNTGGEWQQSGHILPIRSNLTTPPYYFEAEVGGLVYEYSDDEKKSFDDFTEDTRPIPQALKLISGVSFSSMDFDEIKDQLKTAINNRNISAKSLSDVVSARHRLLWKF